MTPFAEQAEALYRLTAATIRLAHRLNWAEQKIHRQGQKSGGRRGILRSLAEHGPQTVPQMARVRPVTRQHIQGLVNALADDGLVEFAPNPAHRRSHLVTLTERGRAEAEAMRRREFAVYERFSGEFSVAEIDRATDVLARMTAMLAEGGWQRRDPATRKSRKQT